MLILIGIGLIVPRFEQLLEKPTGRIGTETVVLTLAVGAAIPLLIFALAASPRAS